MIDLNKIANKKNKSIGLATKKTEGKESIFTKDIHLGQAINDKTRKVFYDQLGTLLEAGVDIRTGLELALSAFKSKRIIAIFEQILAKVVQGAALSEAMLRSGHFSNYECQSIQIGEETGRSSLVLAQLSHYYNSKIQQKRQIVNALSYPIVVMVVALSAVSFMIYFVVPMFADVFKRFGGELPLVTQKVIGISNYFTTHVTAIGSILLLIVVTWFLIRKKYWMRVFSTKVTLALPVVGTLTKKIYLTRFCTIMELLISAKIPLLRGVQLVKTMLPFIPLEEALEGIEEKILKGKSLHECMKDYPIFDTQMVSLIKVGEEVNKLDDFFGKLAKQYEGDVEHQTKTIGNLVEPLLLVFLGVVVGTILVAMYLPMFSLSNSFGG